MSTIVETNDIPTGYIAGAHRLNDNALTHLYEGDFNNVGRPMCSYGYNDPFGGYSILRNRVGKKGICTKCLKRAKDGLEGVEPKTK